LSTHTCTSSAVATALTPQGRFKARKGPTVGYISRFPRAQLAQNVRFPTHTCTGYLAVKGFVSVWRGVIWDLLRGQNDPVTRAIGRPAQHRVVPALPHGQLSRRSLALAWPRRGASWRCCCCSRTSRRATRAPAASGRLGRRTRTCSRSASAAAAARRPCRPTAPQWWTARCASRRRASRRRAALRACSTRKRRRAAAARRGS